MWVCVDEVGRFMGVIFQIEKPIRESVIRVHFTILVAGDAHFPCRAYRFGGQQRILGHDGKHTSRGKLTKSDSLKDETWQAGPREKEKEMKYRAAHGRGYYIDRNSPVQCSSAHGS